ncbi:MAG TPA: 4a-hydroxytetrahydrobiopterin dehydratase, partial [Candidatus Paceibacterota bacterium]
VPGWNLSEDGKKISKEFKFKDFIGAINFVERVADVAEMEDHHPDIHVYYNKVVLELWTHAIGGLSENDFIVAAKVDAHN